MTYSLAGRCTETGQIGYAVATSSVCVGGRVGAIAEGMVVFSQARTDPRLHAVGLAALKAGANAEDAVTAMAEAAVAPHWRQLGALTATGPAAHHTGSSCLGHTGGVTGADSLAIGNFLGTDQVLPEMIRAFEETEGTLAERLLAGMIAGEVAGSERDPLQSAALVVMGEAGIKDVDLRVDSSATPLQGLVTLLADWQPKAAAYRLRAIDPDSAPSSSLVEGNIAPT